MSIPPPVLSIASTLRRGDHGHLVKLAQRRLASTLANPYPDRIDDRPLACAIDGDFGPQTERAVRQYQRGRGFQDTGEIDPDLFAELSRPLTIALTTPLARDTLAETVVAVAQVHLKQGPRECGGDNQGDWVELYCDGAAGFYWCAGGASFWVRQAAALMGVPNPVPHNLACDTLGHDAQLRSALIHGGTDAPPLGLKPGALFLLRSEPGADRRWHHCGVVTAVHSDHIESVEANTNPGGSSNGYGVFARERKFRGLDFISMDTLPQSPSVPAAA